MNRDAVVKRVQFSFVYDFKWDSILTADKWDLL